MVGANHLVQVEDLRIHIRTEDGIVKAVDGITFDIDADKVLGVVGESGCGKSITALSLLRLEPRPHGTLYGSIRVTDDRDRVTDLVKLDPLGKQIRRIRARDISMIFQEPMTAFNPVYTIGNQIAESVLAYRKMPPRELTEYCIEMLRRVRMPSAEGVINRYPHELSGGMRQRAMIALALSCRPRLLIADEPTTALDVTVQASIIRLMKELQQELGMAIMFITHDLGVIAEIADDVQVMYMGKIVESGSVRRIYHGAKHPYTMALLKSVPNPNKLPRKSRLASIEGSVPDPFNIPEGCRFRNRCPQRMDRCSEEPPLFAVEEGLVRCWLYEGRDRP